ncbi:MAG: S53 family peptidase, partial [Candidatus Dormibacteraceae bacterium]
MPARLCSWSRSLALATLLTLALAAILPLVAHAAPANAAPAPWDRTLGAGPPEAQRVAATTSFYNSIESKLRSGQSLTLDDQKWANWTAQYDVLDYGLESLWAQGFDGAGTTVAYIVSNPDNTLKSVLQQYDALLGLPPVNLTQINYPAAAPGATCDVNELCDPIEDELDAESIHTMAPYAHIIFVTTPVPESVGMQGWPQIAQAIEYIADHHLANVISVSEGDGEGDFSPDLENKGVSASDAIHSMDPAYLDAAAQGIPVLFAAGDCGPTEVQLLNATGQCTPNVGRTAGHPVDSPWVTAVGGSIPDPGLGTPGGRIAPDSFWVAQSGQTDAGGAGISKLYRQPSWQKGLPAANSAAGRAYPDITMDADDGTSQASPTLAGVLAIATQMKGGDLGTINPALYAMGPKGRADGIVDIQSGQTNSTLGVKGYSTGPGYSIAAGWGTIYAPQFVPALVKRVNQLPALEAAARLSKLERHLSLSTRDPAQGAELTVTGHGFIPGASAKGSRIKDGVGAYPPRRGQPGWTEGGPTLLPISTAAGQT